MSYKGQESMERAAGKAAHAIMENLCERSGIFDKLDTEILGEIEESIKEDIITTLLREQYHGPVDRHQDHR